MDPAAAPDALKYGSHSQIRCQSRALQSFLPTITPPRHGCGSILRVFDRAFPAWRGPRSSADIRTVLRTPGIVWSPYLNLVLQNMVLTVKLDADLEHCRLFCPQTLLPTWTYANFQGSLIGRFWPGSRGRGAPPILEWPCTRRELFGARSCFGCSKIWF